MKANYHTHTYLCNHASGTMREYIENAVKTGYEQLGFSDHGPYIFDKPGYYSNFRMKCEEAKLYVNELLKLKEEYKKDIKNNDFLINVTTLDNPTRELKGCYLSILIDKNTFCIKNYNIYVNYTILNENEVENIEIVAKCNYYDIKE